MAVRRIMSYLSKRALPRQGQDVRVEAGGDLPVHEDPVWQNATRAGAFGPLSGLPLFSIFPLLPPMMKKRAGFPR